MSPDAAEIAIGAGRGIGGGVGLWAVLRFIRWGVEFFWKRFDIRTARLEQREQQLEERFNARLRHVEQELDRYREATMTLVNALAEQNPQDPALRQVSRILNTAIPMARPNADLDELVQRAKRTGEA